MDAGGAGDGMSGTLGRGAGARHPCVHPIQGVSSAG